MGFFSTRPLKTSGVKTVDAVTPRPSPPTHIGRIYDNAKNWHLPNFRNASGDGGNRYSLEAERHAQMGIATLTAGHVFSEHGNASEAPLTHEVELHAGWLGRLKG